MDTRRKLIVGLVCTVAVMLVIVSGAAAAGQTECNATYTNTTLRGGVVVNAGDTCVLNNVTVNGKLIVTGGSILVTNSTINGGWSITGNVTAPGFMCGNTINGGLNVHGVTSVVTLAFGETNAGCAGGTINGGASFRNNPGAFVEVDAYTVNGPLLISGNAGGEVEGTTVHGPARCQPGIFNDGDGGPNTYHGPNHGCPA